MDHLSIRASGKETGARLVEPGRSRGDLRGFQRVTLAPGAKQTVSFTLDKSDFGFYDNRGTFVVEPGSIDVYAGHSSNADMKESFTVGR